MVRRTLPYTYSPPLALSLRPLCRRDAPLNCLPSNGSPGGPRRSVKPSQTWVPDYIRKGGYVIHVHNGLDPFEAGFDAWPASAETWDRVFQITTSLWTSDDPFCGHRCLPRLREPLPFRATITRALILALLGTACECVPHHAEMFSIY